ncbi:MAG: SgcJ/EcaC family oxidoreductase [Pirellulales bacterium]
MSLRHGRFAAVLVAALWSCVSVDAAEDAATLQKVVGESSAKYAELFAKQDAAGLAALFTPEAEYVDADGVVFHGRAAIEAELAANFEVGRKGKLEIEVTSIRPIADGVAIEEGATTFRPEADGQVSQSRYIALHARQTDGSWLLAAVRELAPPQLSPHEQLKTLAWLLGDWREESVGGVVRTSWKWSDDGVALLASFTVRDAEGNPLRGNASRGLGRRAKAIPLLGLRFRRGLRRRLLVAGRRRHLVRGATRHRRRRLSLGRATYVFGRRR